MLSKLLSMFNLKENMLRFPLAFLCQVSLIIVVFSDDLNHIYYHMILLTCFFSFVSFHVLCDSASLKHLKKILIFFSVIAFFIYSFLQGNDAEILVKSLVLLISAVLMFLVSPYLVNSFKSENEAFCGFAISFIENIIFSCISVIMLIIGVFTILHSVEYLFDFEIKYFVPYNVIFTIAYVVGLSQILSNIPSNYRSVDVKSVKNFMPILCKITMTLILVSFIILYTYIAKIIIDMSFVKGKVSYMILAAGVLGVFMHVFSYFFKNLNSKVFNLFHKYFYYFLFVPIIMLFFSVFIRIEQYGVTYLRYYVVMLAIWLFMLFIYFIFSKKPKVKIPFLLLSVMLMLSLSGPWGVFNLSITSQINRLESILDEKNAFTEGKLTNFSLLFSPEEQINIRQIVKYIDDCGKLDLIKPWFVSNDGEVSDEMILAKMNQYISIHREQFEFKSVNSNMSKLRDHSLINVNDVDYYIDMEGVYFNGNNFKKLINTPNGKFLIKEVGSGELLIQDVERQVDAKFYLRKIANNLLVRKEKKDVDIVETFENDSMRIKLYVKKINGHLENGVVKIRKVDFGVGFKFFEN